MNKKCINFNNLSNISNILGMVVRYGVAKRKTTDEIIKDMNSNIRKKILEFCDDDGNGNMYLDIDEESAENIAVTLNENISQSLIPFVKGVNEMDKFVDSLSVQNIRNIVDEFILDRGDSQISPDEISSDNIRFADVFKYSKGIPDFKQKMYGSQIAPYKRMEAIFNNVAMKSIFIKGSGSNAVAINPDSVEFNIAVEKISMMKDIIDWISSIEPENKNILNIKNLISNTYSVVSDDTIPINNRMSEMNNLISGCDIYKLLDIAGNEFSKHIKIKDLSRYVYSKDESEKRMLDAYNKAFILANFDELLDNKLDGVVDISYYGQKTIFKEMKMSDEYSRLHTTWTDNDDVVSAIKECGGITRIILESMMYYNSGVKTSRKIGFNEINDGICTLKNFTFNQDSDINVIVGKNVYNLRDTIISLNRNPIKSLKTLTEIITKGYVKQSGDNIKAIEYISSKIYNTNNNIFSYSRKKALENNLYSLFANIVDLGLYEINNKSVYNPDLPNYFSYVANYVRGAYRTIYTQRYNDLDDSGTIKTISLSEKPSDEAYKQIERSIYSSSFAIEEDNRELFESILSDNNIDKEYSIENNFRDDEGDVNGAIKDEYYIRMNNIPFKRYDGSIIILNAELYTKVSGDGKKAGRISLRNAENGSAIYASDLFPININPYIDNSNFMDELIENTFMINTTSNVDLKKYLYKNQSSMMSLFESCLIINMISNINNDIFNDDYYNSGAKIENGIKRYFQQIDDNVYPVKPLLYEKGINNTPSYIYETKKDIVSAIITVENKTSRDTVVTGENTTLSVTGMQRLINTMDEQIDMIRKSNDSPAKLNVMSMKLNELYAIDPDISKFVGDSLNSNEYIYLGNEIEREANINGVNKKRSDFNVSECIVADILLSYLDDSISNNKDYYSFVTSTNSDKTQIHRTKVNSKFVNALRNMPKYDRIKFIKKAYKAEFNKIYDNISKEFDKINDSINNILSNNEDRDTVAEYIKSSMSRSEALNMFSLLDNILDNKNLSKIITPDDNFESFNNLCLNSNIYNSYDAIMSLVKIANRFGANVKLIDQAHLQQVKKVDILGNKITSIRMNPGIMAQLFVYNMGEPSSGNNIYDNANESVYNKFGITLSGEPNKCKIDTFDNILNRNNIMSIYYSMKDYDFKVNLYDSNGKLIGFKGFKKYISEHEDWFTPSKMILMKYNGNNVTSMSDMRKLGMVDDNDIFIADMNNIEISPLFEEFNTISGFISDNSISVQTGSSFNHILKGEKFTFESLMSALENAQTKRNVSNTASIHPLTLRSLNGLDDNMRISVITDISEFKSSYAGSNKNVSTHDGGAFMHPLSLYWWNNSMNDNKSKGYILKPFIHFYDESTMTGGIIKSAAFALTNDTIRSSKTDLNMAKKFMDNIWTDEFGAEIIGNIFDYSYRNWSNNGNKNLLQYIMDKYRKGMFYRDDYYVYKIDKIEYDKETGEYIRYRSKVYDYKSNKNILENAEPERFKINSNFGLWNLFGGQWSMNINESGSFEDSESSLRIVSEIASCVGTKNGKPINSIDKAYGIETQADVYQFMKKSDIQMFVTNGAIKQGAANINKHEDVYFDKRNKPSSFVIKLQNAGIQLDKSHNSDGGMVSELTQVMSALSSMGYTKELADSVYKAMGNIVESSIDSIVNRHRDINGDISYNDVAAEIVVRAMSESNSFDDDVREKCKTIINRYNKGEKISYNDVVSAIDINDNVFVSKATPVVMSIINKSSIKKKYSGGLFVIAPSYGRMQLYGNKLYGQLGISDNVKAESLMAMQRESDMKPINVSDVRMQHVYKIVDENGKTISFNGDNHIIINSYDDYDNLKNTVSMNPNCTIHEVFMEYVDENDYNYDIVYNKDGVNKYIKAIGRELAQDDYRFKAVIEDKDATFNLMDLHSTKMMFIAKNNINNINFQSIYDDIDIMCKKIAASLSSMNGVNENDIYNNILYGILGPDVDRNDSVKNFVKTVFAYHQTELELLSKSSKTNDRCDVNVLVDNEVKNATVILGSLEYVPHETISPNVNRTKFGLNKETRISDVTPELFARNFIDNFRVRTDSDLYHYALLHGSGRHVLIYDTTLARKDVSFDGKGLNKLNDSMFYYEKGTGYKYRIDKNGNKLYRVRDTDEVYTNGREEIIRTNNPSDILKTMSFMGMRISPSVYYDNKGRKTIDKRYIESTNKYIVTTLMSSRFVKINDKGTGSSSVSYWLGNVDESKNQKRIDLLLSMAFKDFNEGDSSVNNYTQTILLDELNNNGIEYFNNKRNVNGLYGYIYDNAMSTYNSFIASLDILAARTPSQTMQSYMSMRNVEFETSGMNTCYVATSQIWFQGSDFDIDAVTFQEYAINERGQFIGWSPYFQNTKLKESFLLPFPTGFELKSRIAKREIFNDNEDRIEYMKLFNSVFIEDIDSQTKISRYKVRNNASISDKAEFIEKCNKNKIIAIPTVEGTADEDSYNAVVSFVNEHNTYINDNPNSSSMMKNFITYNSIKISSDLSNLIESESSVDDSKVINKLGSKNKNAGMRQDDTYGNFTNRYAAFFSNMVGKDVVAISAAGLKNFFAITHYYNTINISDMYNVFNDYFVKEDYENAMKAAFAIINKLGIGANGMGLKIGDKIYNTSSNFNPDDKTKEMIIDVYSKLSSINEEESIYEGKIKNKHIVYTLKNIISNAIYNKFQTDEALMLSELLSEATDNAKNLNLSKINATSEMAPLYIFGLTIGMDIEDIYKIMTSKTAQMIDKIRSGNIFYGTGSNLNIESIYDNIISNKAYIRIPSELEERASNFFDMKVSDIVDEDTSKELSVIIGDSYKDIKIRDIISSSLSFGKIKKRIDIDTEKRLMLNVIDAMENSYNKLNNSNLNGTLFNFIDTLRNIIDYRYIYNKEVKNTGNDYIRSLINLEKGNKEMLRLALISGINKGVKATQKDISSHRMKLSEIMVYNRAANSDVGLFMVRHKTNPLIKDKPNTTYMFNFNEFNRNVDYREKSKVYYNTEFKHAFNIVDIMDSMHNFKAYSKAVNESNNIINSISSKKKISDDITEAIQSYIKIPMSSSDKDAIIKSVNSYINNILFNSWLNNRKSGPIEISIPKGYTYFIKNSDGKLRSEINESDKPEIVYLGTETGNASFIKLMYDLIIPNIKRGYLDDEKTIYSKDFDKTFMNDLKRTSSNKIYSRATAHIFAPFTNSRSNDEFDAIRIDEGKASMKSLNDIKYKNGNNEYSIGNLMYLYNELLYSGTLSSQSMEIYFDDTPLKSEYLKYDKEVASSTESFIKNILGDRFEVDDTFMMEIAPFVSTYRSNLPYVKYFDNTSMELKLYKYSRRSKKNNINDEDLDNDENASAIEDEQNNRGFVRYGYDHLRYTPVRSFDSSPYSITSRSSVNDISIVSDKNSKTIKLRGLNDDINIVIDSQTGNISLNTSSNSIDITDNDVKNVLINRFKLNSINDVNDLYSISYGALKTYVSNIINQKLNCE